MDQDDQHWQGQLQAAVGADEATATVALRGLQAWFAGPDADAGGLQRLQDALLPLKGGAFVWVLLARAWLDRDQAWTALQCWHRAQRAWPGQVDEHRLRSLTGLDATAWQALALRLQVSRAERLRAAYADIRHGHSARDLFRIDRALAGYLGEAVVQSSHPTQRPKVMYVPGLGDSGFLDPAQHPLVAPLTAAFPALQAEFDEAVQQGRGIEAFLGDLDGKDKGQYLSGSKGAAWDALFFYRHGRRYDDNHRRFPRTSAVLDSLDLCRVPGQAPEVCFSILQPHTRIEPHHGVTNARVVIHIPLRVPQGCYLEVLRVGRHHWREGQAMVFDDSFEHCAENPSAEPRGILLMDAWHPRLTPPERAAFCAIIEAITRIEASPVL